MHAASHLAGAGIREERSVEVAGSPEGRRGNVSPGQMSFMYPIGAAARIPLSLYCAVWTCFAIPNAHIHISRLHSVEPTGGLLISGHTWRLRRPLRRNAASLESHLDFDALGAEKRVAAYDYPSASGAAWTTFRPPRSFHSRRFNGRKDCLYYSCSLDGGYFFCYMPRFSIYPF